MYQNLIYISRYLDFYYQILNPYLLLPTTTHLYPYPPHPYLPLNNFFKANEHRSLGPIYISRYLDFYYQILNPYLLLPTTTHLYPYLPLNNFFKANEHRSLGPIFSSGAVKQCEVQYTETNVLKENVFMREFAKYFMGKDHFDMIDQRMTIGHHSVFDKAHSVAQLN